MYYVVMNRDTYRLDIVQQCSGRERNLGEFESVEQASRFIAGATQRIIEFKREVAAASHHLDKQLATLVWLVKEGQNK